MTKAENRQKKIPRATQETNHAATQNDFARGESSVESNRAPVRATRLEGELTALQRSVGTGLPVIDLLLQVEAIRCGLATDTTLPEDLQYTVDTLQARLHSPGKRHTGLGYHYSKIQNSGGYSHYGDKYFFNGAPTIALIDAMAKKLDCPAGMLQIGQVISTGDDPKGVLPQSCIHPCQRRQ